MANTWPSTSPCSFLSPQLSNRILLTRVTQAIPANTKINSTSLVPKECFSIYNRPGSNQVILVDQEITANIDRCLRTISPWPWEKPKFTFSQFQQCSLHLNISSLFSPGTGSTKPLSLQIPVFISFGYIQKWNH